MGLCVDAFLKSDPTQLLQVVDSCWFPSRVCASCSFFGAALSNHPGHGTPAAVPGRKEQVASPATQLARLTDGKKLHSRACMFGTGTHNFRGFEFFCAQYTTINNEFKHKGGYTTRTQQDHGLTAHKLKLPPQEAHASGSCT